MINTNSDLFVTKEGLEKLKSELKVLVEEKRPEVAQKIKEAREMGDISENAMYDSATQEQAYVEGRIAELEEIIKSAKITATPKNDLVNIGSRVTVHIEGDEETYHIVGAPEADPAQNKISHESPLGQALMGKKPGEKVEMQTQMGKLLYTVLKIS